MAHPRYKGHREQVQLLLTPADKAQLAARARAAELSYSDYVRELVRRDQVDANGRPEWAAPQRHDDELPLAM